MHDHVLVPPDPRYRLEGREDVLGFEEVCTLLDESAALSAMRTIVDAAADEHRVTPLVGLLARWLIEAGLENVEAATGMGRGFSSSTGEPLLISRGEVTVDYHLRRIDRRAPFANRWIWKLAGAINRFYHTGRALGAIVDGAVERRCARLDARLISCERLLKQVVGEDGEPKPCAGEWEARRRLAALSKTLVVPLGLRANFQLDIESGLLSWGIVTPNDDEIPAARFDDDERWTTRNYEERVQFALMLAERVGAGLAAGALKALPTLSTIIVTAYPHFDGDDELAQTRGAEFPKPTRDAFYRVEFSDDALAALRALDDVDESFDVHDFLRRCHAVYGGESENPFRIFAGLDVDERRLQLPEAGIAAFDAASAEALGCEDTSGLRISADGIVRHAAVSLARTLARAASTREAIDQVRRVQESSGDALVYAGCNHLMEALVRDDFDIHDQNLIVFAMMPEDPCEAANLRFEGALRGSVGQELALDSAVLEALYDAYERSFREDTPEVVHRMFETYAQRILYNLDRRDEGHPDYGKSVELISASLVYCALNIAHFHATAKRSRDAVDWAYRACACAPTDPHVAALAGQIAAKAAAIEDAREMYECALSWSATAHEAADVYLQLGTVLWQAGDNELGSACLQRAGMLSHMVAPRAMATQWSLAKATGRFPVPFQRVDSVIEEAQLPLMPDESVLDDLERATRALVDANVFRGALDVMGERVRSRPDPVLWAMYCSMYRTPSIDADDLLTVDE